MDSFLLAVSPTTCGRRSTDLPVEQTVQHGGVVSVDERSPEDEGDNDAGDQSHIIDLIDKFLEEVDRDDEAVAEAESVGKDDGGSRVKYGVLLSLLEQDDAVIAGKSISGETHPAAADDDDSTIEETLVDPVVVSPSETGDHATTGGTRGRSSLTAQAQCRGRFWKRLPKKAPSVSVAGTRECSSTSTTVLHTACAGGHGAFSSNNLGIAGTTAEPVAAVPRRSATRSAKGRNTETQTSDDSGRS